MEKQEYIEYWIKTSINDLSSMESNFKSANYDWSLFIGHLALEKIFKALWIKNNNETNPPRTHNLKKLADEAQFYLSLEDSELLLEINDFNLETRYPDYKLDFHAKCTKEFTGKYLSKIKELHECILKLI